MVSVLCPALKVEIIQYAPRATWKEMEYHLVMFLSESLSEEDIFPLTVDRVNVQWVWPQVRDVCGLGNPPPEGGPDGAVAETDGVDPVPTVESADHDASDGPIADVFTVAPGCSSAAAIGTVRHNWNRGGGGGFE